MFQNLNCRDMNTNRKCDISYCVNIYDGLFLSLYRHVTGGFQGDARDHRLSPNFLCSQIFGLLGD